MTTDQHPTALAFANFLPMPTHMTAVAKEFNILATVVEGITVFVMAVCGWTVTAIFARSIQHEACLRPVITGQFTGRNLLVIRVPFRLFGATATMVRITANLGAAIWTRFRFRPIRLCRHQKDDNTSGC